MSHVTPSAPAGQSASFRPPSSDYGAASDYPASCEYFERRGLRRYAGVWSIWALGVGAVISGHFSGWNLGLAVGGWGGMLIAAAVIAVMFLALSLSIAEMSAALPLTGGSYPYARFAVTRIKRQFEKTQRLAKTILNTIISSFIFKITNFFFRFKYLFFARNKLN